MAWERRHGVGWVLERMVQGKGRSPDQHSQRLSRQDLLCLKSGRTEGPGESSYQHLPLQLATFTSSLRLWIAFLRP